MFGVAPGIVAQIQSSGLVKDRTARSRPGPRNLVALARKCLSFISDAVERTVERPYAFLVIVGALSMSLSLGLRNGMAAGIYLWIAAEALCVMLRPRFRYAAFNSGILFCILIASVERYLPRSMDRNYYSHGPGLLFISFLVALSFSLMSLPLGGVLVVLGGVYRVSRERRRERSLSRQDLLLRMFKLQDELKAIPAAPDKEPNRWIEVIRRHLLLAAVLIILVPGSLRGANNLAHHIDPVRLMTEQQERVNHASGVTVLTPDLPPGYIAEDAILSFLTIGGCVALAFAAGSRKRVGVVIVGTAIGRLAVFAWVWPVSGWVGRHLTFMIGDVANDVITYSAIILIVRFSLFFNRMLARYRMGAGADEGTIVAELLEIRHRLSADPVQVYVLVVDAAGSTQMKRDADPLVVEYSFGRYQAWISRIITASGGRVDVGTGDGAICAFGSAEQAYEAARRLQREVADLNREENRLPMPFRLRVALHAGAVVADLDKVQFTEVIDVTAHVEKLSPVGGIALTKPFLAALVQAPGLAPCGSVDGVEVFVTAQV